MGRLLKGTLLLGEGVGGYSGALVATNALLEEATEEDEFHGNFRPIFIPNLIRK